MMVNKRRNQLWKEFADNLFSLVRQEARKELHLELLLKASSKIVFDLGNFTSFPDSLQGYFPWKIETIKISLASKQVSMELSNL